MTTVKTPKVFTGITPEVTAHFIEAIARDKAVRLATLSKATVVLCTMPVWVRAEEARALFGVPPNKLIEWTRKGKVKARKCDPKLKGSAAIFETKSLLKAIDELYDYRKWLIDRPDRKGKAAEAARTDNGGGRPNAVRPSNLEGGRAGAARPSKLGGEKNRRARR